MDVESESNSYLIHICQSSRPICWSRRWEYMRDPLPPLETQKQNKTFVSKVQWHKKYPNFWNVPNWILLEKWFECALTLADDCLLRGLSSDDGVELLQHLFNVALCRLRLPTQKTQRLHIHKDDFCKIMWHKFILNCHTLAFSTL